MPTFTAPLTEMQRAFAAVAPYVSDDWVTPVITTAALMPYADGTKLLATDRYCAAEYLLPDAQVTNPHLGPLVPGKDQQAQFLVPMDVVRFVRTLSKKQLLLGDRIGATKTGDEKQGPKDYTVTLFAPDREPGDGPEDNVKRLRWRGSGAWPDDRLTVTVIDPDGAVEFERSFFTVTGLFPPVGNLFPAKIPNRPIDAIGMNPRFLERIAKSARALAPSRSALSTDPVVLRFWMSQGGKSPAPMLVEFQGAPLRVLIQPNVLVTRPGGLAQDQAA